MSEISPFRFVVTSDIHQGSSVSQELSYVCDSINSIGGPGDFMITTGDLSASRTTVGTPPYTKLARDMINSKFGNSFRWVPVIGNHDIQGLIWRGREWITREWSAPTYWDPTAVQESIQSYASPGPTGCSSTQFYFFYHGVMFIVMNWYWSGKGLKSYDDYIGIYRDYYGGDTTLCTGGTIRDEQIVWLESLLPDYKDYPKMVFGHGNAFADSRHYTANGYLGGTNKGNRNRFWQILENNNCVAYISGHTHESKIQYINNSYVNSTASDNWTYGESNVPEICSGGVHVDGTGDSVSRFLDVQVTDKSVLFNIYTVSDDGSSAALYLSEEIAIGRKGGTWYYTQNKFGSEWFNNVDNQKGWTIDFNLKVDDVQNNKLLPTENNKVKGVGLYVNDGTKQEVVNFLTQEIVFSNEDYSVVHDNTLEHDYRLIGKNDNLTLFAKKSDDANFAEVAKVNFSTKSTPSGNALNPCVFEDTNGNLHAAWWDDGNSIGSIFYSKFDGDIWSDPEEIVDSDGGLQFPAILLDSDGNIYVTFEEKKLESSIIGIVYKNDIGWSKPYYTGNVSGFCKRPKMIFDSQSNVCVVWEDGRGKHPDIYIDTFMTNQLQWKGEVKLSDDSYGSFRPSVSSYLDNIFVSWTKRNDDMTTSIEMIKYNAITSSKSSIVSVSSDNVMADNSSILCSVSGKIFVVWNNNSSGQSRIYYSILSPLLDVLVSESTISNGNGKAYLPVLSEHVSTGDIYIAWHDIKDGSYWEFDPLTESEELEPYLAQPDQQKLLANSALFIALYQDGTLYSSQNGSFDVVLSFKDNRNAYNPALPPFFTGELPVVYSSYWTSIGEYEFAPAEDLLLQAKCAFYDLSRISNIFYVNYGIDNNNISFDFINRDYALNKNISTKEIRFGDFSDVLGCHYIFKEIKYYLNDAVPPYSIKEISADSTNLSLLSASDAVVNNYGDIWIVGICGMYYYVSRQGRIISLGENEDLPGLVSSDGTRQSDSDELKQFKSIAFDMYNNMFVGGINSLRYSKEHINGFKSIAISDLGTVNSMAFDRDNVLFIGTDSGLKVFSVTYSDSGDPSLESVSYTSVNNPSSSYITSIKVDDNNCVWIGSRSGLYRFYKNNFLHFSTVHGLPSDRVNDIAIRSTAIRYIATANGIGKMIGFNFDDTISSKDDSIWNNNVKSIMWKDPNILFAGTLSAINQIAVDDDNNSYSTEFYSPYNSSQNDDFSIYYIDSDAVISSGDIIEVYLNGNKIDYGYHISNDNKTILFDSSLNHDDVVEVMIRSDLEQVSSFEQTTEEKNNMNGKISRVKDLVFDGTNLYSVVEGDENEIKINDSDSILPFDKVHLDTVPPNFISSSNGITIAMPPIDRSVVRIEIEGVTDDVTDSTGNVVSEGSGVDRMIVSNYDNFTTDGFTPQSSVPFSTSIIHDLGVSLDDVVQQISFTRGIGNVVQYFSATNELYAGVSKPAIVYKYNWSLSEWEVVYEYGDDQYIDFIANYNNNLLISVGHDTNVSKIYVYQYVLGIVQSSYKILSSQESRSYCYHEIAGKLYVGSGKGYGDEYSDGAGDGGSIYLFDDGTSQNIDPSLSKIVSGIDNDIYSITHIDGGVNLLAATGSSGYICEIDVQNRASFIVYNSNEALSSITSLKRDTTSFVFAGGEENGVIRRSIGINNTYDTSFRTTPHKVYSLKVFPVVISLSDSTKNYDAVYSAVGDTVYYFSSGGTWVWKYTHTEDIKDMTFNSNTNTLYIVSNSGITKINPLMQTKTVYLKLIDRAGNESVLDTSISNEQNKFIDSINISDLANFVNENRIFEIDESGTTTYNLAGNSKFYSADRIEEERGEYISEVFDGTNDLVKWETISWESVELHNTQVLIYVRTSTSSNDILISDWSGPYYSYQSSGVDISHFVGQFIQFKVVLISSEKGISPSFYRASIRAITSESIHFFTTNFVMPTKINKGIITSQKVIPVSADVVFGINTTNSIDWNEYQEVDENRIFNVNQTGENLRVGIKLISPNRSLVEPTAFDEYGPYNTNLFVNTVDFSVSNNTGSTKNYHFRVSLYSDVNLSNQIFSAYSSDSSDGFSINGIRIPEEGASISNGETVDVLFVVPGSANIICEEYYFVKVEYIYDSDFVVLSDTDSFVASCTSSFIDTINFDFTNNGVASQNYHFRIKFYQDQERTNEYKTVFSGNDVTGWVANGSQLPEEGQNISSGETTNIIYTPVVGDFSVGTIYYLSIEAYDETDFILASNSYTFQMKDVTSLEYCGEYFDVPIVKNFSIMFELNDNEFITLNI